MERKLGESTDILKRALQLDSSNLTAQQYLAANLWQLHRYIEAKQELKALLKKKPGDKPATLLLGMVSENLKDYAAAARLLGSVPALVRERWAHLRDTVRNVLTQPTGAAASDGDVDQAAFLIAAALRVWTAEVEDGGRDHVGGRERGDPEEPQGQHGRFAVRLDVEEHRQKDRREGEGP